MSNRPELETDLADILARRIGGLLHTQRYTDRQLLEFIPSSRFVWCHYCCWEWCGRIRQKRISAALSRSSRTSEPTNWKEKNTFDVVVDILFGYFYLKKKKERKKERQF